MAKPKLIEITSGGPPRPLGTHGMALWQRITDDFDISDAGAIELLTLACQALDRAESCREQIDATGEISTVNGQPGRAHPLLRDELANRAFVTKALERLGLTTEPTKAVGRPAGSWNHEKAAS